MSFCHTNPFKVFSCKDKLWSSIPENFVPHQSFSKVWRRLLSTTSIGILLASSNYWYKPKWLLNILPSSGYPAKQVIHFQISLLQGLSNLTIAQSVSYSNFAKRNNIVSWGGGLESNLIQRYWIKIILKGTDCSSDCKCIP